MLWFELAAERQQEHFFLLVYQLNDRSCWVPSHRLWRHTKMRIVHQLQLLMNRHIVNVTYACVPWCSSMRSPHSPGRRSSTVRRSARALHTAAAQETQAESIEYRYSWRSDGGRIYSECWPERAEALLLLIVPRWLHQHKRRPWVRPGSGSCCAVCWSWRTQRLWVSGRM